MSSEPTYILKAIITLLSTEMGGRKTPVYSGYRPSFSFNTRQHYSGEIKLIDLKELEPGHSSHALIHLLSARTLRKTLKPRDSFIISEGNKTVGTGIIENVKILA